MREQNYAHRAIVSPAGIFKCPMDVVEATGIQLVEKVAILKAWEADERALLRAEDEGMSGGEHAHLHKVLAALEHLKNLGSPEKLVRKISGENGPGRNAQTAARASVHPLHS